MTKPKKWHKWIFPTYIVANIILLPSLFAYGVYEEEFWFKFDQLTGATQRDRVYTFKLKLPYYAEELPADLEQWLLWGALAKGFNCQEGSAGIAGSHWVHRKKRSSPTCDGKWTPWRARPAHGKF